jgi:3-carboxy-cis,cis-muconate cycloisomerase
MRDALTLLENRLQDVMRALAALEEKGLDVRAALAQELQLDVPLLLRHTQHDGLAETPHWLSLVSASPTKLAQYIILPAQTEGSEARETDDGARGGSSATPQKHNPIASELVIAAARANASLLSTMHPAMIREHERATHG